MLCAFDEIPTLHPIPSLLDFSGTGRKFGAVPILGFQSNSQLLEKYGEHRTKTLTDAAGVFMGFSIKGSDGAGWVAKQLGKRSVSSAPNVDTFSTYQSCLRPLSGSPLAMLFSIRSM
ncbi:type IV secretion system DNA-binding domain-containing protein [Xenorhabdus bovienii]|uniref:type IV secretion system DNA-binding domain-containing protein n=1 Tax=Xenorhabdus bovienii TaxID=40576 RepID=UPI0039BDF394